jgi:hypothetical protein
VAEPLLMPVPPSVRSRVPFESMLMICIPQAHPWQVKPLSILARTWACHDGSHVHNTQHVLADSTSQLQLHPAFSEQQATVKAQSACMSVSSYQNPGQKPNGLLYL